MGCGREFDEGQALRAGMKCPECGGAIRQSTCGGLDDVELAGAAEEG